MEAAAEPLLMDVRRVASTLSISPRLAQTLIYRGELRSVKLGRRRLVTAADLNTFVLALREDAPSLVTSRPPEKKNRAVSPRAGRMTKQNADPAMNGSALRDEGGPPDGTSIRNPSKV